MATGQWGWDNFLLDENQPVQHPGDTSLSSWVLIPWAWVLVSRSALGTCIWRQGGFNLAFFKSYSGQQGTRGVARNLLVGNKENTNYAEEVQCAGISRAPSPFLPRQTLLWMTMCLGWILLPRRKGLSHWTRLDHMPLCWANWLKLKRCCVLTDQVQPCSYFLSSFFFFLFSFLSSFLFSSPLLSSLLHSSLLFVSPFIEIRGDSKMSP